MNVIIFGTSDCAVLAKFYLDRQNIYCPIAFTADAAYVRDSKIDGLPVIPFEEISYSPQTTKFFAPLNDNQLRFKKASEILDKGYDLISYVSNKATVFGDIGRNCFILEDNTVQPFVKIGNNVILWSGNHIGHHSVIEDNVFISSHVVISGHCTIKSFSWIGVNSSIRDHTIVETGSFIGMGSVVVRDTERNTKYKGVPAKKYVD